MATSNDILTVLVSINENLANSNTEIAEITAKIEEIFNSEGSFAEGLLMLMRAQLNALEKNQAATANLVKQVNQLNVAIFPNRTTETT